MNALKTWRGKTVVIGTALMASSQQVFAADYTSEIATAIAEGSTNLTAVIGGVIALAVIGFGVGSMLGWFGRK